MKYDDNGNGAGSSQTADSIFNTIISSLKDTNLSIQEDVRDASNHKLTFLSSKQLKKN